MVAKAIYGRRGRPSKAMIASRQAMLNGEQTAAEKTRIQNETVAMLDASGNEALKEQERKAAIAKKLGLDSLDNLTHTQKSSAEMIDLAKEDPKAFVAKVGIAEAQRMKEGAKALSAIKELERESEEWVHISHLRLALEPFLVALRGRLLALPSTLANMCNPMEPNMAEKVLSDAINELLIELSEKPIEEIAKDVRSSNKSKQVAKKKVDDG